VSSDPRWVGIEEYGGRPTQTRRGSALPPHWRLQSVWATERPRTPSVSADGTRIAFVQDRDTSDVWLLELPAATVTRLTAGREPMPYWEDMTPAVSPDGTQVAYGDDGQVLVVPTTGGPPVTVCEGAAPAWLGNDRLVVSVTRKTRSRLAVVTLDDPWPRPVGRDYGALDRNGDELDPAVSPSGAAVAFRFRSHTDLTRSEIRVADLADGAVRALTGTPGVEEAEPVWSPDGRLLAFTAQRGEWWDLRLIDVATGEERLVAAVDGDVSEPAWSPDGTRIAGVRLRGFRSHLIVVDVAGGTVTEPVSGGTCGTPMWVGDDRLVVTYEDHVTPAELRSVRLGGAAETVLTPVPAPVRAAPHVVPEEVAFPSADGVTIEALLYLPRPGERAAAAIVNPHGGPKDVSGEHWDGVVQYFVDKGYALLAPNYRGSIGWGKAFEHLNDRDWGGGDVRDCLAAADFLRTLDAVDPQRLAIVGASYGSYLALGAVVEDAGERFRCAVCKYGDCDLVTTWAQGDWDGIRYCGENMLGHPGVEREVYLRGSPIHRLERIAVPVLVATGERDERVSANQSAQLVAELRRLGKTFEYVTYPTEGHGLLRAGPYLDYHRRLERFLDWHLL
jgi:dipeptidyl aminopeptidase/acylaminoacyl peptidase